MKRSILLLVILLSGCVGPHVRAPSSDVPFVYPVGWWSYQTGLKVKSLEVKVLDSRLNMFNTKTLAEIVIKGEMKGSKRWRPVVTEAHLSEKMFKGGSNFRVLEAEITVTPIIDVKSDDTYDGSSIPFSIKQEIILNSMYWGENTFVVKCGDHEQNITVHQFK